MYQAILLEDNPFHLENAQMIASSVLKPPLCKLNCFSSAEQLRFAEDIVPQIAILDIELGEDENGLVCAQWLQTRFPGCQIIFLTSYADYVSDVYEVPHLYFVLKSTAATYLPKAIQKALLALKQAECEALWVHPREKPTQRLLLQNIAFFERSKRVTFIYHLSEKLCISSSIEEIEQQISSSGYFVRCHQSFLINLSFVKVHYPSCFQLLDDRIVPISRRYQSAVGSLFVSYLTSLKKTMV